MNYLQLVQSLHQILRADNNTLGASPDTVSNQQGLLGELVYFIKQSWLDIQGDSVRWRWMWGENTLTLVAGQDTVQPTAIPDFESYILANSDSTGRFITMYRDSIADETIVRYVPYPAWQQSYLTRGERGTGQPANFTILPDNRLRFDLIADVSYTVRINYRKEAQTLLDDLDIPNCPPRHHMAIVWWAIVNYYCTTRDGAEGLRQRSLVQMRREMQRLYNEQGDDVVVYEGSQ